MLEDLADARLGIETERRVNPNPSKRLPHSESPNLRPTWPGVTSCRTVWRHQYAPRPPTRISRRRLRHRVDDVEVAWQIVDEFDHMLMESLEGQAMELGWVRDNTAAI